VLPFPLRHGAQRGFEREPAADEQEEKRDVQERGRRASRPEGRRPRWPEPHRSNPAFGTMKCHGSSVNSEAPFFISWNPRPLGSPAFRHCRGDERDVLERVRRAPHSRLGYAPWGTPQQTT